MNRPPEDITDAGKDMRIGLVVSDDLDYGWDLANAYACVGLPITLYLSQKAILLYLWGERRPEGGPVGPALIEELYRRGLAPRDCRIRLFNFPRVRDPRSLIEARRLARTIRADDPDVVHVLMGPGEIWIGLLAHLLRGLPLVSTLIVPKPNLGESLPEPIPWLAAELLVTGSDMVIVNGRNQVELVNRLYRVPYERIAHVPLGPRTAALHWGDRQWEEEAGVILFPGKAQPRKGLEYLIKAQPLITQQVPHARIVIAAHGEEIDRCRGMIADKDRVEIHEGFLTSAELSGFFQRASLVALPYLTASTSGLLNTACVFGKPVVASRVGSLAEYVEDGVTGFLVPPADIQRLADAIVRLLLDDETRRRMGENARRRAHDEQICVAHGTLKVYARALHRRGKAPMPARTGPREPLKREADEQG